MFRFHNETKKSCLSIVCVEKCSKTYDKCHPIPANVSWSLEIVLDFLFVTISTIEKSKEKIARILFWFVSYCCHLIGWELCVASNFKRCTKKNLVPRKIVSLVRKCQLTYNFFSYVSKSLVYEVFKTLSTLFVGQIYSFLSEV